MCDDVLCDDVVSGCVDVCDGMCDDVWCEDDVCVMMDGGVDGCVVMCDCFVMCEGDDGMCDGVCDGE